MPLEGGDHVGGTLTRTDNERSLAAMRRLPAIREEGVLARRIWRDGAGHDAVLFALLADDFDPAQWPEVELVATPD